MKTLSTFTYHKKQCLQKKRRLAKVSVFLLVWCIMIGLTIFQGSIAQGENKAMQTVVVNSGDTLWTLAKRYAPTDQDLRSYVEQIRNQNNLSQSIIYPGQTLDL